MHAFNQWRQCAVTFSWPRGCSKGEKGGGWEGGGVVVVVVVIKMAAVRTGKTQSMHGIWLVEMIHLVMICHHLSL